MTDETTPVPTALIEALRDWCKEEWRLGGDPALAIIACLPKPPPEFSDEVCEAFYRATFSTGNGDDQRRRHSGRGWLTRLYESGWLVPSDDGSFIIRPPKEQAT